MKRFCLKVSLFMALQAILFVALLWNYDVSEETNYLAATVDKHVRLARTAGPRVIVTGGSNVAFGIQSDRLAVALGRPVINMGLAAGEGIDFMLSEITGELRQGDVVVLSLEYDRFNGGFDANLLEQILIYRPANAVYLKPKHLKKVLLDRGLKIAGGLTRRAVEGFFARPKATSVEESFARRGFNMHGDLTVHHGQPARITPAAANSGKLFPERRKLPTTDVINLLADFAGECRRRGVIFTFSFPPHAPKALQDEAPAVAEIQSALQAISNLVLLDSPADQTYEPSLFFDTGYHLTQAGGALRTEKLASSLRTILPLPATAK
ncbi:MAG: hypothetical protein HY043_23705 [Verrucomicrobia bacterium]|nr:hypothetical protein [Verrucomicrobiota bacterium]